MGVSLGSLHSVNPANSRALDLYDWALILYCLLMMPLFETVGLPPLLWVLLILVPAVAFGIGKKWLTKKFV
jgi:hypothetical protein